MGADWVVFAEVKPWMFLAKPSFFLVRDKHLDTFWPQISPWFQDHLPRHTELCLTSIYCFHPPNPSALFSPFDDQKLQIKFWRWFNSGRDRLILSLEHHLSPCHHSLLFCEWIYQQEDLIQEIMSPASCELIHLSWEIAYVYQSWMWICRRGSPFSFFYFLSICGNILSTVIFMIYRAMVFLSFCSLKIK